MKILNLASADVLMKWKERVFPERVWEGDCENSPVAMKLERSKDY